MNTVYEKLRGVCIDYLFYNYYNKMNTVYVKLRGVCIDYPFNTDVEFKRCINSLIDDLKKLKRLNAYLRHIKIKAFHQKGIVEFYYNDSYEYYLNIDVIKHDLYKHYYL